jgi:hypothetical protein
MAQLAGPESTVTWYGTFAQILLPGVVVGTLLGWAEHIRTTGGRRGWRWLAAAPLAFPLVVLVSPETLNAIFHGEPLFSGAIGGGALALPVFAISGGYALSRRGPRWTRLVSGLVALAPIPLWALTNSVFGPEYAPTTPNGAWIALYFYSYIATLALACAIPHRPVQPYRPPSRRPGAPATAAILARAGNDIETWVRSRPDPHTGRAAAGGGPH